MGRGAGELVNNSFVFYQSFQNAIECLPETNQLHAYQYITKYALYGVTPEQEDSLAYAIFLMAKPQIDANLDRRKNGRKGGRPENKKPMVSKNTEDEKPMVSKNGQNEKPNVNVNANVNANENVNVNEIKISSNEEIEQSSSLTMEINNLIDLIKQQCDSLGVAYDKQKDRYFAKFILTAKEYGGFAEKIGQTRVEFALNVLKASFQIKFRKGICSGPMKIYQNYAEVYNETLKQHSKNQKNLIQSF